MENINYQHIQFLVDKPGYLKWGKDKLATLLNVTPKEAELIKLAAKHTFFEEVNAVAEIDAIPEVKYQFPNILLFDIETSLIKAWTFQTWQTNIGLKQIIDDWFMLSWSAKWLHSEETMSDVLTPAEVLSKNDKRVVTSLWKLIDEADIVIAHYGDKFDIKKMNSRFICNGLNPPSPYKSIDTKKVASTYFGFTSNKLDGLAIMFGFETKMDTDIDLWIACMEGDPEALKYMEKYNKYDSELLEKVYLVLRPWIKNHPNVTIYDASKPHRCTACNSDNLEPIGYHYTPSNMYPVHRCKSCGAISKDTKPVRKSNTNNVFR